MDYQSKILVTGGSGMVGRALLRLLKPSYTNVFAPSHGELDLCNQTNVMRYFADLRPDYVFHLAARVGGIHANNTYPAAFIYENTQMHCNVIHAAYHHQVKKLLFPGSACTYPKHASQPIPESALLQGEIEPTNLAYAAAKLNGIIMCQSYAKQYGFNTVVPMPTNTYGVGDNFNPHASHVIPALMARFHDAKIHLQPHVTLWGSGKPMREFIYVDDLADALLFLIQHYHSAEIINVGTQAEIGIADLARLVAEVVGYQGQIIMDTSKPDGAPRKCLLSDKLFSLGWKPRIDLQKGLHLMYRHHFQASTVALEPA